MRSHRRQSIFWSEGAQIAVPSGERRSGSAESGQASRVQLLGEASQEAQTRANRMKNVLGIVGSGMIGRDPFDPGCWSGSGFSLFKTLRDRGRLHRAFGVEVPHPLRGLLMAMRFHPDRRLWSERFNLYPAYYRRLTRQIELGLRSDDFGGDNVILQLGGIYNAHEAAHRAIPTYSYHDANVSGLMKSPYFRKRNLAHARAAFDYEKSVYQDISKLFVVSEYWRRSFIDDFGVAADRVVKLGIGVNVDVPPDLDKDYSTKNVVFVGVDFRRKGGDGLVSAFQLLVARHPTARLHIVGPREVPSILKESGHRNVVYHGFLSRDHPIQRNKLLGLLQEGTLLVLPSLYEPFGIAPLEAMLYKMPVIATNHWSFPDFVRPDVGLLIDAPTDRVEIFEKMDVFLRDPDLSKRAGEAGRRLVMSEYLWDHVVDRLLHEIG